MNGSAPNESSALVFGLPVFSGLLLFPQLTSVAYNDANVFDLFHLSVLKNCKDLETRLWSINSFSLALPFSKAVFLSSATVYLQHHPWIQQQDQFLFLGLLQHQNPHLAVAVPEIPESFILCLQFLYSSFILSHVEGKVISLCGNSLYFDLPVQTSK